MNGSVRKHLAKLLASYEKRGEVAGAIALAAVCIALSVALGLRGRGIAATQTEQVLDCHYAGSGAHAHDASCYDAAGNLVCPLVEREYHVHDDGCYTETRELVCGLEEHAHTEACYDEAGALVCGLEEHAHTDACYKITRELTCGKEETSETHTHGPGCFREVSVEDADSTDAAEVESVEKAVAMPAQKLEEDLKETDENGDERVLLTVAVKAPEGALPAGTTLELDKVERKEIESRIEAAVEKSSSVARIVDWIEAVDVAFVDAEGNRVQPAHKVELKVTSEGIRTAQHPALARTLDEKAQAKYHKDYDAEVLDAVAKVNRLDEDLSTGNEDTLKINTALATTLVVLDAELTDAAEAAVEQAADGEAVPEADADGSMTYTGEAGGVKVTAVAPATAFEGDVELSVVSVLTEDVRAQVEETVAQEGKRVSDYAAVDIAFTDGEGNEVAPAEPVSVSLTSDVVLDAEEPVLVQVADEAAVVEGAEAVNSHNENLVGSEDTLRFEGDGTGTYALVGLETITTQVITASGDTYEISVTYGPEAGIPSGATLEAREIADGTDEYESYRTQAAVALAESEEAAEIGFARFFDVSILVDGTEVEPSAPVEVKIAYKDGVVLSDNEALMAVHFADTGTEVINADLVTGSDGCEVTFTQESFSVTGTVTKTLSTSDRNLSFLLDGEEYILLVRTGNSGYYAVDQSGNIIPVSYDENEGKVTFGSDISVLDDVSSYLWAIEANGTNRRISNKNGGYLTLQDGTVISTNKGINLTCNNGYITIGNTNSRWYLSVDLANSRVQSKQANYSNWNGNGRYSYPDNPATVSFVPVYTLKDSEGSTWYGRDFDTAALTEWYSALKDRTPPLDALDKTASVSDYDNRIYKVDLTASSGIQTYANDIDLAFMLDFSNSMLFPASLTSTGVKTTLTQNNLNAIFGPNDDDVHIIVADKNGTATQYVVFKYDYYSDPTTDKADGYTYERLLGLQGKWVVWDASFYAKTRSGVCGYNSITTTNARWRQPTSLPDNDASLIRIDVVDGYGYTYAFYEANDGYFDSMTSANSVYSIGENDNGNNRLYYLKKGVKQSIQDIIDIALKDQGLDLSSKTVHVAYNLFWETVGATQPFMEMTNSSGSSNDFNNLVSQLAQGNTDGGTRQDRAMADTGINWESSATKYAILITDGAPLQVGTSTEDLDQLLINAANELKQKGVTLITVGVALDEVWNGQYILHTIASTDEEGNPYYYHCERAEDLEYILYDILREMMGKATVSATVTDTVDEAFYPVDKTGAPLNVNDVIDLQGNRLGRLVGNNIVGVDGSSVLGTVAVNADGVRQSLTTDGKTLGCGIVAYDSTNGTWMIEWNNQDMPWEGWNGSIYVKAKEDFLGGNTVSTNDNAIVISNSYVVKGTDSTGHTITSEVSLKDTAIEKRTQSFETPHVNVDELALTSNSSEWTVYLGTQVNPGDQLNKLLEQIKVREDVTESDDDWRMADTGVMNPDKDERSEEFSLASVLRDHTTEGSLSESDVANLLAGTPVTRTYAEYGHQTGTITLAVVKAGETANTAAHATSKTGKPVETYTLTVAFTPKDADSMVNYHTTTNGSAGEATGVMTSENVHTINVFKKGLTITKVNEGGTEMTAAAATFDLYREANQGESGAIAGSSLNISGMPTEKNYVKVANGLTTGTNGSASATVDTLTALLDANGAATTTPYYLVETNAPDGYIAASTAIPISLKFADDVKMYMVDGDSSSPLETWVQSSGLVVSPADSGVKTYVQGSVSDEWVHSSVNEITDYKEYKIINTSGVELPAAGGPGTAGLVLAGAAMILVGATTILRRRA